MVVVGRDGPPTGQLVSFVGQRIRHAPPFGSVFSAWGSPGEVDGWLGAAVPPLGRTATTEYRRLLDIVREEQRAILVVHDRAFRFAVDPKRIPKSSSLLVPMPRRGGHRVFYVGVPIFDAAGTVSLAMFVGTGRQRYRVIGVRIVQWTVIAGLIFFAVLIVERVAKIL